MEGEKEKKRKVFYSHPLQLLTLTIFLFPLLRHVLFPMGDGDVDVVFGLRTPGTFSVYFD